MADDSFDDDDELDRPRNEININQLEIQEQLGTRIFYVFHRGVLRDGNRRLEVVVKGPANENDKTQQKMITDELHFLTSVPKHPNILGFVGFAMRGRTGSIVSEYAGNGCLRRFLRDVNVHGQFSNQMVEDDNDGFEIVDRNNSNNQNGPNDPNMIYISDLVAYGYQIASGMRYLAGLSYVHRQLALRGIYITNDKTIRIGDFGLARKDEIRLYYRVVHKEMPLPFHTTAPECLNHHKFTEESDVWSFAVCLYEIFTLGGIPYEGIGNVLEFIEEGNRLPKPEYCPQEIYDFMLRCWDIVPENRPKFNECVRFLENFLEQHAPQVLVRVRENLRAAGAFQRTLEQWIQ